MMKMKKIGNLFMMSLLLCLFFTGSVLAVESNDHTSLENLSKHLSISFDGNNEKTNNNTISTKQKERVSPSYEGTGDQLDFNNPAGEQVNIPNEYESFSIIGKDNRTRVTTTTSFSYRAIVYLAIKYPNSNTTYGCTGFMVNANTVVTAGHCVYDHGKGGWAKEITASPGRNGNSLPYGSFTWETVYTVNGWKDDKDPEYDYGAIKLYGTPGNNTGWFGYRTSSPSGLTVNVTGYPCDQANGTMWIGSGTVNSVKTRQLGHTADTAECQSGAPVYRNYSDTGQTAIAINAYGIIGSAQRNWGTRITNAVFDNISFWESE